jgi:hypothetical protein
MLLSMSLPAGGWPFLRSAVLVDLRSAIERRSRVLAEPFGGWTCTRSVDEDGMESMRLEFESRAGGGMAACFWETGQLWFRVSRPPHEVELNGAFGVGDLEQLVETLEQARLLAGETRAELERAAYLRWVEFGPCRTRY